MSPAITIALWDRFIVLSAYSTMMYVAATATIIVALILAARRDLPLRRVVVAVLLMAIAVPVGARLLHAAIYTSREANLADRLFAGGFQSFSLYGGLFAAAGMGLVSSRLLALDVPRLADTVAPALGLGIALMRVGCFLAGCCFGIETVLPWGVVYPIASDAHVYQIIHGIVFPFGGPLPVHPTQLYELMAALIGAGLAGWLLHRKAVDGTAFLVATAWFSAFRWGNFYLVARPTPLSVPEWFYPALYCGIIVLCLWLLARRYPPASFLASIRTSELSFWTTRP